MTTGIQKIIADVDNNGRMDSIEYDSSVRRVCKRVDNSEICYDVQPGPTVFVAGKPVDFKVGPRELSPFMGTPYIFKNQLANNGRFYAAHGLGSFVPGQMAAYYTKQRVFIPMRVDGIAIEFFKLPNGTLALRTDKTDPGHKTVVHRAFQEDSPGSFRTINSSDLVWVVKVGEKFERLDPNRIANNATDLTPAEKLLQPLFADAQKLKIMWTPDNDQVSDSQKRVAVLKLEKIAAQWKVAHPQSDPRAKQITDPILWNGILGAMAKLAGLTPADFPG